MVPRMAPIETTRGSGGSEAAGRGGLLAAETAQASGRQVADRILRNLRERIASHAIPPGSRLRELDLAAEFAAPRLNAREALDALVHQGFLERQPNRGVVVRRRELPEILQLFDVREVNEGLCARLAARNAEPESWGDLLELFGAPMEAIVARKDLDRYVRNYERMRRRLIAAANSPPLAEILHRLNDMTCVFGQRVLLSSDRSQHALHDHRAVLTALRHGNAAAAERARRATIANVRAAVERYHAFVL